MGLVGCVGLVGRDDPKEFDPQISESNGLKLISNRKYRLVM